MPIKPENKGRYPKDWPEISARIRFDRAEGLCEFCEEAWHGEPHPITGSIVVLTVAHLDHQPENSDDDNLAAMCQRCHLHYDLPFHRGRIVGGLLVDPPLMVLMREPEKEPA